MCSQADDAAFGRDPGGSEEPIAQHPVRTKAYHWYAEEADSAASCKDDEANEGIRRKASLVLVIAEAPLIFQRMITL